VGSNAFLGVRSPQDGIFDLVLTTWVRDGPNSSWRTRFYQGILIHCQSYHGDYVCSFDGVVMSGGNRMDSSTQVLVVKRVWAPVATSCRARQLMPLFPEVSALVVPTWYRKALGEAVGSPSMSRAGRRG
jgi:hypothetical protein